VQEDDELPRGAARARFQPRAVEYGHFRLRFSLVDEAARDRAV
jgi:hypothetical protein